METVATATEAAEAPEVESTVHVLPRRYQPTATEIDAAERYAGYTTRITYDDVDVDGDDLGPDGRTYRWAGIVQVIPRLKRFAVILRRDAREADLECLERVVARVKAGHMNAYAFRAIDSVKAPGTTFYSRMLGYAVHPGDLLGFVIVECDEPACDKFRAHHSAFCRDDVVHTAEQMVADEYEVHAERCGRDPWVVSIDIGDVLDEQRAAAFANDLGWVRASVARLNGGGEAPC